jgi:hypothetical protein
MNRIRGGSANIRWIGLGLLVLLPTILAACSRGSGGSGY